jgi:hypothetical protein
MLGTDSLFHRNTPCLSCFLFGRNITLIINAVSIILNFIETCISHSKKNLGLSLNIWQLVQLLEFYMNFTGIIPIYHPFLLVETYIVGENAECILLNFIERCNSEPKTNVIRILMSGTKNKSWNRVCISQITAHLLQVFTGSNIHFRVYCSTMANFTEKYYSHSKTA